MWVLAVVFAAVVSGEHPPGREGPCDLVKVRAEERRLSLAPSAGEVEPGGAAAISETGAVHFLTLRCEGQQYVARFVGILPGIESTESKPSVLTVRFEGKEVFIKWPDGKEIKARYAAIKAPPPAKLTSPPKK